MTSPAPSSSDQEVTTAPHQQVTPQGLWTMLKQAVAAWIDDYAPSMGAALAYYTMFSLAPLLLLAIGLAGLIFGEEAARGQIVAQLGGLVGSEGAEAIEGLLKSANHPGSNIVATVLSVATLLIAATSIFGELQSDLDRIWRAPTASGPTGLWGVIRARLLSLGMVASIGFLLLVSLVVSAMLSALGSWWSSWFGGWTIVLQIVNQVTSFGIITVLFALMYRILPRVAVGWHDVWVGSAATALLFTIGKYLVGLYIAKAAVASGFGAAGSIVVLLVWVYYSSQLFLLGAEFTWVYAHSHGSRTAEAPAEKPGDLAPAQRGLESDAVHIGIGGVTASPVASTGLERMAPDGWEFLYAGMVALAFGVVHWYSRDGSAGAARNAPRAARGAGSALVQPSPRGS